MIELRIPKKEVDYWNELLAMGEVDFEEHELDEGCVMSWTIDLGNGVVADLNVIGACGGDYLWSEMVWYKDGYEIACADPDDGLDGEWHCDGHPEYSVNVVAVE